MHMEESELLRTRDLHTYEETDGRDKTAFGKVGFHLSGCDEVKSQSHQHIANLECMYVSNLVDAHILVAQALHDACGKPVPEEGKSVDGQGFDVRNHYRILFWEFQRGFSASVGLPVKS